MGAAGTGDRPTADEGGFRAWVAVRLPGLRRKAYLLTGDWHRADDLVQDTLVSMYAVWPRIARGDNIDAYASRVLLHKHIDERRRPWRREHAVADVPDRADDGARRGFDQVDGHDEALVRALVALPATQRGVLVLRYADDLTLDEIARVLDLPLGTVKSRLSRATEALRAELAAAGYSRTTSATGSPGRDA
jgi:RNA polymerase sigma-70 factor (sigma-E family)